MAIENHSTHEYTSRHGSKIRLFGPGFIPKSAPRSNLCSQPKPCTSLANPGFSKQYFTASWKTLSESFFLNHSKKMVNSDGVLKDLILVKRFGTPERNQQVNQDHSAMLPLSQESPSETYLAKILINCSMAFIKSTKLNNKYSDKTSACEHATKPSSVKFPKQANLEQLNNHTSTIQHSQSKIITLNFSSTREIKPKPDFCETVPDNDLQKTMNNLSKPAFDFVSNFGRLDDENNYWWTPAFWKKPHIKTIDSTNELWQALGFDEEPSWRKIVEGFEKGEELRLIVEARNKLSELSYPSFITLESRAQKDGITLCGTSLKPQEFKKSASFKECSKCLNTSPFREKIYSKTFEQSLNVERGDFKGDSLKSLDVTIKRDLKSTTSFSKVVESFLECCKFLSGNNFPIHLGQTDTVISLREAMAAIFDHLACAGELFVMIVTFIRNIPDEKTFRNEVRRRSKTLLKCFSVSEALLQQVQEVTRTFSAEELEDMPTFGDNDKAVLVSHKILKACCTAPYLHGDLVQCTIDFQGTMLKYIKRSIEVVQDVQTYLSIQTKLILMGLINLELKLNTTQSVC